ncbi:CDP-alcohol phosphatidyltransferase family protein [Indioceanicola profundi]|uniref:CDP-alcohol phosphatidyltransferase family protein n=1 Tax=Indioceanicola profundi TaxID=2220096 RepID=UPI000E6AC721|nr:CDP-alcohol phosphatidyltransferase family protein [Indioceanicola profundi]
MAAVHTVSDSRNDSSVTTSAAAPAAPVGVVVGSSPVRLWGMSSTERLHRIFRRSGLEIAEGAAPAGRAQVLFRADYVFDEPLAKDLIKQPGTVLTDAETGQAVAAHVPPDLAGEVVAMLNAGGAVPESLAARLRVGTPGEISSSYNNQLRKKETPYLLRLTAETLPAIEKRMFSGSYKGVTDLVTKYVWPTPARHVTKWCAIAGLTPNFVTTVSALCVAAAFYLFWTGHFLPGLFFAWMMTFLDTVDGKLARVTLTSSPWGNVFDHGIDLVHPPFWYWAWIVGLAAVGMSLENTALILSIVVIGYVAQRIQEGIFLALFKIEIHIWRPFDSFFRLITARRNPNLLLLTGFSLVGRPDLGMVAVAWWTVLSFLIHCVQIVQALAAKRRGPITSWLSA